MFPTSLSAPEGLGIVFGGFVGPPKGDFATPPHPQPPAHPNHAKGDLKIQSWAKL